MKGKVIVGIMLIVLSASMLSVSSNMAADSNVAVSNGFLLETDKTSYAHGEWVDITFTNGGDETVYFKQMPPWIISGPPGVVAPGILMFLFPELHPGESFSWGWDQLNELVDPPYLVPAGTYTVYVEVYDEIGTWNLIANLSISFEIVGPEISIDTNSTMIYFNYDPSLEQITANITGQSGTQGYFNITIPTQLMSGSLMVLFDDEPVDYASEVNSTHISVRLTYTYSTHSIKIVATATESTWVHLGGFVNSYGGSEVVGRLLVYAKVGEWAKGFVLWSSLQPWDPPLPLTPLPDTPYTYSFCFAELVNTTMVELNYTGKDFYISGLWNVYNITYTYYFEPTTLYSWTIEPLAYDATGELYVTGNWTEFTIDITGINPIGGIVIFYYIKSLEISPGDFNSDGIIDIFDLTHVAKAYGDTPGIGKYSLDTDLNGDLTVDICDLTTVAASLGKEY